MATMMAMSSSPARPSCRAGWLAASAPGLCQRWANAPSSSGHRPRAPANHRQTNPRRAPSIWDAMAFSGPAPERINGRLAMVGFCDGAGGGGRARRRAPLAARQRHRAGVVRPHRGVVLSMASLVPLLQGESAEGRAGAIMNANAELWNGCFAMLGLVALAATEIITGAPFINVEENSFAVDRITQPVLS
ncbi:hypothetical protein ZWY2020_005542 [Hordeum vulgare]|nr:hypothetical protein ZWY2020_005542 [Hordeum vulgare]